MDEAFLQEQIDRVRAMTEQMSEAHSRVSELSAQISRDRDSMRHNELFQVRDYRTEQAYDPLDAAPRRRLTRPGGPRRRRR